MNETQRRVGKFKYLDIDGAYVLVSAPKADKDASIHDYPISPIFSFFYDAGGHGAEWEPRYGPIQIWTKANELTDKTREHYFYDFVINTPGNWSQLAVEEQNLPYYFHIGRYDVIFDILRKWATNE